MNPLKIYNSLSREKEIFAPINPPYAGMYVCGPTVSGETHLGHSRPYVTFDIVYRFLQHSGYKVRHVRNITDERLIAETNLQKTRKTLSAVLDTLQDPYFEADRAGVITFVNRAYWEYLGYPRREDVVGKNFRHFIARESIRKVFEKFEAIYQTRLPIEPFDYHYRRQDGRVSVAEIVASPIIENSHVVGTRGIILDISDRIKVAEVLQGAKEAAEYRANELAAINRVAVKVSQSLDLKDILQSVCRELTEIFEIRNAGIGLLTPDKKNLEIVAFHTTTAGETSGLDLMLPGRCFSHK